MQKYSHKKSVAPVEVIISETAELSCDGGKGGLGHPRVFLIMNADNVVDCPYCGRHYQLAKGASATSAH